MLRSKALLVILSLSAVLVAFCSPALATGYEKQDPYEVLGVSRDASPDEINKQFRKLALQFHPDKNNQSPEARKQAEINFKAINAAKDAINNGYRENGLDAPLDDEVENDLCSTYPIRHTTVRLPDLYGKATTLSVQIDGKEKTVDRPATLARGWSRMNLPREKITVSLALAHGDLETHPLLKPFRLLADTFVDVLYDAKAFGNSVSVPSLLTGKPNDDVLFLNLEKRMKMCPAEVFGLLGGNGTTRACYKFPGMGVYGFRPFPVTKMGWGYGDMIVSVAAN